MNFKKTLLVMITASVLPMSPTSAQVWDGPPIDPDLIIYCPQSDGPCKPMDDEIEHCDCICDCTPEPEACLEDRFECEIYQPQPYPEKVKF